MQKKKKPSKKKKEKEKGICVLLCLSVKAFYT